jgi:hypothetical protein
MLQEFLVVRYNPGFALQLTNHIMVHLGLKHADIKYSKILMVEQEHQTAALMPIGSNITGTGVA